MRTAWTPEEFESAFQTAQKETEMAFADSTMYIEHFVENPRHIEFQILADKYGNVIHLGERDCSIQRNHQKLIEESPSVALSDELRKKMGDAAVKAAKAAGYENAGTIEFLLEKSGNFYLSGKVDYIEILSCFYFIGSSVLFNCKHMRPASCSIIKITGQIA